MKSCISLVDSHVHSAFSPDSKMRIEDACRVAIERNIRGLVFTDHMDKPSKKWRFDPLARRASIQQVKSLFSDKLLVFEGVELGFNPLAIRESLAFLSDFPFDCVILSVHTIDGIDVGAHEYRRGKTLETMCLRYVEEIYRSIAEFDDFDTVGHIGYLLRYLPRGAHLEHFSSCCVKIDDLLRLIIHRGKALEVNASGYRYGLESPSPTRYILERYHSLGGTLITVGSDAHNPTSVGYAFDQVSQLLLDCGFLEVTYFVQRQAYALQLR